MKVLISLHTSNLTLLELSNFSLRSEFEKGDQVIIQNIKKAKKIPGTKEEKKYTGPYTVEEVRPSHLVARKDQNTKTTKLPIHLSRKYYSREHPVNLLNLMIINYVGLGSEV